MSEAVETTDPETIRSWVEERQGRPAWVRATADGADGLLRIDFGERGPELEVIEWPQFFEILERNKLAFLYQAETAGGKISRFHKFIQRRHS